MQKILPQRHTKDFTKVSQRNNWRFAPYADTRSYSGLANYKKKKGPPVSGSPF